MQGRKNSWLRRVSVAVALACAGLVVTTGAAEAVHVHTKKGIYHGLENTSGRKCCNGKLRAITKNLNSRPTTPQAELFYDFRDDCCVDFRPVGRSYCRCKKAEVKYDTSPRKHSECGSFSSHNTNDAQFIEPHRHLHHRFCRAERAMPSIGSLADAASGWPRPGRPDSTARSPRHRMRMSHDRDRRCITLIARPTVLRFTGCGFAAWRSMGEPGMVVGATEAQTIVGGVVSDPRAREVVMTSQDRPGRVVSTRFERRLKFSAAGAVGREMTFQVNDRDGTVLNTIEVPPQVGG